MHREAAPAAVGRPERSLDNAPCQEQPHDVLASLGAIFAAEDTPDYVRIAREGNALKPEVFGIAPIPDIDLRSQRKNFKHNVGDPAGEKALPFDGQFCSFV